MRRVAPMRACIGGRPLGKFVLLGNRDDRDRFLPIFAKAANA
jgi:hypothetical protein